MVKPLSSEIQYRYCPQKGSVLVPWGELALMKLGYSIARPFLMQETLLCLLSSTYVSLPCCNTAKGTEKELLNLGLPASKVKRKVNIGSL